MNISKFPRGRDRQSRTRFNATLLAFPTLLISAAASLNGCFGDGTGISTSDPTLPFRTYYVYTANQNSKDISVFAGAQDGTLTFIKRVASPDIPHKLIVSGSTLYAACNYKLEVFSGAATGNLSLAQTVVTDAGSTDYYPGSMAFGYGGAEGNPAALLTPTKLYVLANSGPLGGSELQSYSISANGTISLSGALDGFSAVGAIATLSYAAIGSPDGINIIGVTNLTNSVSMVLDNGKNMTVTDTVKLSSAPVAILSGIQSDTSDRFYVTDQSSKNMYELSVDGFASAVGTDNPQAKLMKTLSLGTTPTYLGSSVHFPTSGPFTDTDQYYTANADLSTISAYTSDQGSELAFQKVSGAQPDAGAGVTAVNGIEVTNAAGKDLYYVYSTNNSGSLKFYSGNGTLTYLKGYDTQGSGVVDLAITSEIGSRPTGGGTTGGGTTGGGTTGGKSKGPFVEYLDGAYLSGSSSIDVTDKNQPVESVNLGILSGPFSLAGETSTTLTASTSTGTQITSAPESYASADRYLVLIAADKFGSAIDTYTYPKNSYPSSSNEWIVIFNGIPDFISGMDFYVLGPGKTLQNSSPVASNINPGVGAFVSIPANLGKFTVVATYAGGKSITDIISTSSSQTSSGATSIVADLADVNDVYSFVFAIEKQTVGQAIESPRASSSITVPHVFSSVRRR